jgi:hypothetical protein
MTTPTVFANGYDASSIKRAPKLIGGSLNVRTTTSLAAGVANGSNVGLLPFNKGAKVFMGSNIYITDIDTATTATGTLGWIYDNNTSFTNDPDGFVTSFTTPQTGGRVEFSASAGYSFEAEGDGWVVYVVGGENVEVVGTITSDIIVTYGA